MHPPLQGLTTLHTTPLPNPQVPSSQPLTLILNVQVPLDPSVNPVPNHAPSSSPMLDLQAPHDHMITMGSHQIPLAHLQTLTHRPLLLLVRVGSTSSLTSHTLYRNCPLLTQRTLMPSQLAFHGLLWERGFPSPQVARGDLWSHILTLLGHQGQQVVTCFLSQGPLDQCLMIHTPNLQEPHDLVLMGSAGRGQGQDQPGVRTPSPHLREGFRNPFLIRVHKHQSTLVCQKMDLLSRHPEDPIRHLDMTLLKMPP